MYYRFFSYCVLLLLTVIFVCFSTMPPSQIYCCRCRRTFNRQRAFHRHQSVCRSDSARTPRLTSTVGTSAPAAAPRLTSPVAAPVTTVPVSVSVTLTPAHITRVVISSGPQYGYSDAPSRPLEDWETEELCSVSPPSHLIDGRLPAYGSPLPVTPSPPPPSPLPSAPVTPTSWLDAATQTNVWWSPTHRVRRRVLERHVQTLTLYPPASQSYGNAVDTTRPRRICDCRRCVRHQLDLTAKDVHSEFLPSSPGVRYIHLPGLPLVVSSATQRNQLDHVLRRKPSKTLVACGCQTCQAHRQLAEAWTSSLALCTPATSTSSAPARP